MTKFASTGLIALAAILTQASALAAVPSAKLDTLKPGMSEKEVLATLGTPDSAPRWFNGTHSLVYQLKDTSQERAYIDIDNASGQLISHSVSHDD